MTEKELQAQGWVLLIINELQGTKIYANVDYTKKATVKDGVVTLKDLDYGK